MSEPRHWYEIDPELQVNVIKLLDKARTEAKSSQRHCDKVAHTEDKHDCDFSDLRSEYAKHSSRWLDTIEALSSAIKLLSEAP